MLRRLGEILFWWAATFGVWLLSLSAVPGQEILTAALVSMPLGLAARAARRAIQGEWHIELSWLKPALVLPVAIVSDAAQVLLKGLLGGTGRVERIPTASSGPDHVAAGYRALDILLIATPPGSFVLDADPDSGEMLVHAFTEHGPSMEERVAS